MKKNETSYDIHQYYSQTYCLNIAGPFLFTIYDSIGDGISCVWSNGRYELWVNDNRVKEGGEFGSEDFFSFGEAFLGIPVV